MALHKSHASPLLCAISVFSVSLWLMNSEQKHTTETQGTQRLHRESMCRDFLCKAEPLSRWVRIYQLYSVVPQEDS